jgi:hypothetical protein
VRSNNVSVAGKSSGPKRWWSKRRGLPTATYESWRDTLRAQPERQPRVLAWARAVNGVCIGSPSLLSYGSQSGWTHVGWHQIERGGWNAETHKLSWTSYDGIKQFVELTEPGRLPELFRERVSATIVAERFVPIAGERGVTVSGRRDLADATSSITWHRTLSRGISWDTHGVQEAADAALAELRREYDLG